MNGVATGFWRCADRRLLFSMRGGFWQTPRLPLCSSQHITTKPVRGWRAVAALDVFLLGLLPQERSRKRASKRAARPLVLLYSVVALARGQHTRARLSPLFCYNVRTSFQDFGSARL